MTSDTRSLRGKVAIVGIGETTYYKHGQSPEPEFKLALTAILAAARMPGSTRATSTASPPTATIATIRRGSPQRSERRNCGFSNMQWGGGGGGGAAAVGNAAAAVIAGQADIVVVYRALAQGQFQRFGRAAAGGPFRRQCIDQPLRHLRTGAALRAEVHALHA